MKIMHITLIASVGRRVPMMMPLLASLAAEVVMLLGCQNSAPKNSTASIPTTSIWDFLGVFAFLVVLPAGIGVASWVILRVRTVLADLFGPKWRHSNRDVRLAAVRTLIDEGILVRVACGDNDSRVRKAAVERTADPRILVIVAKTDKDSSVRTAALLTMLKSVWDQKLLAEFAKEAEDWEVRKAAVERVDDDELLTDIWKTDKSSNVRAAAKERLDGRCGALGHAWVACKCRRCSKARDESHDWDGCICKKCSKVKDESHVIKNCKCEECNKEMHHYVYCKCKKCGDVKSDAHKVVGCRCEVCNREIHDWRVIRGDPGGGVTEWREILECRRCKDMLDYDRSSR